MDRGEWDQLLWKVNINYPLKIIYGKTDLNLI